MGRALLFVIPSMVVTAVSIALFALMRDLTPDQANKFSIVILLSVILSLVGTALVQFFIYRIAEEPATSKNVVAARGIRFGTVFVILFTAIASMVLYSYLTSTVQLTAIEFAYFVALLLLFSETWVFASAFWATYNYLYPALSFVVGYAAVFILTYGFYTRSPDDILGGYTLGVALTLFLSWYAYRRALGKVRVENSVKDDFGKALGLMPPYAAAIAFSVMSVLAVFLDKIIVWIVSGLKSGDGLLILGPYTTGAFLGLIPLFGIAMVAYFSNGIRAFIADLYGGSLAEIRRRTERYKSLYRRGALIMELIGFDLFIIVVAVGLYVIRDPLVLKVLLTTGIGSLFFMEIIFNAAVLPVFRKTGVSAISMGAVVVAELAMIPLVKTDVWYASLGFLLGSLAGFLISQLCTVRFLSKFDYNMFRLLLSLR